MDELTGGVHILLMCSNFVRHRTAPISMMTRVSVGCLRKSSHACHEHPLHASETGEGRVACLLRTARGGTKGSSSSSEGGRTIAGRASALGFELFFEAGLPGIRSCICSAPRCSECSAGTLRPAACTGASRSMFPHDRSAAHLHKESPTICRAQQATQLSMRYVPSLPFCATLG